jgi:xanthine dehydrogenase accessory factor
MNKQLLVWELVNQGLRENIPVMLLYVLESAGSSPGRRGFFMAITNDGPSASLRMEGSIGGGIMEHKFVEMAKEKLRAGSQKSGVRKQVHDKLAATNQSGMICSGEQTILLYPVQKKDTAAIQNIFASLEQNKNGTLTLSPEGIRFSDRIPENDFFFSMKSESDWLFKEMTGYKNHLFIIGGGHCSLALSRLMSQMDFYIHVYDDRADLKTMQENNFAHEKKIVDDYSQLTNFIPPGKNHYVVIMTVGYRSDDIALRALLNKKFKYLGLLGSKNKIEKLFDDYSKEGIAGELLQKIHTPIGLVIKSQTPEEIAISIAAEIIQLKNESAP